MMKKHNVSANIYEENDINSLFSRYKMSDNNLHYQELQQQEQLHHALLRWPLIDEVNRTKDTSCD